MSDNKSARMELERIFGKICMIEEAGIRYIPKEKRKKIKGYTKYDEVLTYHHIKEKHTGGKATFENGALIRGYNHRWLHSLPEEEKELVNQQLQEYKMRIMALQGNGQVTSSKSISLDFNMDDCITIPVYDNKKNKHKGSAKKRQALEKEDRKRRKHNRDYRYWEEDDELNR